MCEMKPNILILMGGGGEGGVMCEMKPNILILTEKSSWGWGCGVGAM